jgi:hypothetical protein
MDFVHQGAVDVWLPPLGPSKSWRAHYTGLDIASRKSAPFGAKSESETRRVHRESLASSAIREIPLSLP